MSEGEPELGMGFVRAQDAQSVAIEFPSATQARLYRKKTAPLRRVEFRVGEKVQSKAGTSFLVARIEIRDELIWYIGSDQELGESELSPQFTLQRPMERFLAGQWDPLSAYELRRRTLALWHRQLRSPARGMIGPRAQLLPHQLYVVQEVSSRGMPRALLADEVGLGKTIEAGWIMHRLLTTGRMRRVLVIVPEALVNQWFIELFKRFNLSFWVPESQSEDGVLAEDLTTQERVILSQESLLALHAEGTFDASEWDLIVVDEAHRIPWAPGVPSVEYDVIEALAKRARGLLLLTATPEQLGIEGHYSRLHLIDPLRFPTFERFQEEHARYQEIVRMAERLLSDQPLTASERKALQKTLEGKASSGILANLEKPAARRAVILALVDHYGTGRVYFRNSRSVVELEHCSFPKRNLVRHPLASENDENASQAMTRWLGEFAREHRKQKTLLICSSAKKVIEWERKLRDDYGIKAVAFHEELPLLARDRNAAYFEDPAGATILLSSEIGGEGRNFQHASRLVLADLPEDPDVLEQRIGRLDRIGQGSDISIHVPFVPGSQQERLLNWHDEVFKAFEAPPKGAGIIFTRYRAGLAENGKDRFAKLITAARKDYLKTLGEIETGRDRLIEINSFDPDEGSRLADSLKEAEQSDELRKYFEDVINTLGIHSEDLDADTLFVEPGDGMYVSYFPGLPPEGLRVTFSRNRSLARNDLALMSWDHPMVSETMESIARQEIGNVSVAAWSQPLLLLECSFVLEPSATDGSWYADEFFPTEPIRVVLEATGKDLTEEWDPEKLRQSLSPLSDEAAKMVRKLPGERIRGLLNKALGKTERASATVKTEAQTKMQTAIDDEVSRLTALRGMNALVGESEIQWWLDRKTKLQGAFEGARVRLDSLLLVVPDRLGK